MTTAAMLERIAVERAAKELRDLANRLMSLHRDLRASEVLAAQIGNTEVQDRCLHEAEMLATVAVIMRDRATALTGQVP